MDRVKHWRVCNVYEHMQAIYTKRIKGRQEIKGGLVIDYMKHEPRSKPLVGYGVDTSKQRSL